jgi:hypothetical protein
VWLTGTAVAEALTADPHAAYAPPQATPTAVPEEPLGATFDHADVLLPEDHEPPLTEAPATVQPAETYGPAPMCRYCGGALPAGRQVNFCPHCGQSQRALRCAACQTELEYGWRHCVNCGAPVGDG